MTNEGLETWIRSTAETLGALLSTSKSTEEKLAALTTLVKETQLTSDAARSRLADALRELEIRVEKLEDEGELNSAEVERQLAFIKQQLEQILAVQKDNAPIMAWIKSIAKHVVTAIATIIVTVATGIGDIIVGFLR